MKEGRQPAPSRASRERDKPAEQCDVMSQKKDAPHQQSRLVAFSFGNNPGIVNVRTRKKPSETQPTTMTKWDGNKDVCQQAVKDATELFATTGKDVLSCCQFDSLVQSSHDDAKEWLTKEQANKVKAKEAIQGTWSNTQQTEHGKGHINGFKLHDPLSSKLMFCWAKMAHKKDRITMGQSDDIVKKLPESTTSPQATTDPESQSIDNPAKKPVVSCLKQHTETLTIVEEEEDQHVATLDKGCAPINACLHEAVFHVKTSNVEKQLHGSRFGQMEKEFKTCAKECKDMINDTVKKKIVFPANCC
jgi:hypothetical protein